MTVNRSMKRVKFMLALIRLDWRTQAVLGERRLPGSARVSRAGETVSVSRTFKDRFGETPKPTRETRALPGSLRSPEFGPRFSPLL